MTVADLTMLLPLIVLSGSIVVIMLVIAFYRNHVLTLLMTMCSLALCLLTLSASSSASPAEIKSYLIVDGYSLFYMGLLFAASVAVAMLSYGYLEGRRCVKEEFYPILLIATLGSAILVSSSHFVSFFLGLELLSVSLYVLIGYVRSGVNSVEAGIKYLILAATSVAFLLFGMALVNADLGTMELSRIATMVNSASRSYTPLFLAGLAMIVIGIGFKLAIVPFHLWTPDVYEGAPAPVTGFIATASKGAVFALLLRYFSLLNLDGFRPLFLVFGGIAIASMFVGNLLALLQDNVKRMLAYSSIAHIGYLLVALLASGKLAPVAVTFYLVAYFITTLGAFGIITVLSGKEDERDQLADYRGLVFRHPWLAGVFTAMLLSLAGIPLTAGFIGKFYVISAGVGSSLWLLVIALIINSAIGLFYYLRVIVAMYSKSLEEGPPQQVPGHAPAASFSLAAGLSLTTLTVLLIWIGVYPSPLISFIQTMVANLI